MQEEVCLDYTAYYSSPTELPESAGGIGYSRHKKIPQGNPPAFEFELDDNRCQTGDRRAGERKASCSTEDTVREENVPPEFFPDYDSYHDRVGIPVTDFL